MNGQQASNNPSAKAPDNPRLPPLINPAVEKADVSTESTNIGATQQDPTKELKREFSVFQIASLAVQGVLAIIGIGALCIYGGQLGVMRGTLDEMKRGGVAATDQAWQAIGNINWLARTMDGSLQQAQRALDASIEISRTDQRAWVGVVSVNGANFTENVGGGY